MKKTSPSIATGCAIVAYCSPILFALYLFVYIPYIDSLGLTRQGATGKWHHAMLDGKPYEAIFWAKKTYAYEFVKKSYENVTLDRPMTSEKHIAQAYELAGQYDDALYWYKRAGCLSETKIPPRWLYRQGKRREAFEEFCNIAMADAADVRMNYGTFYSFGGTTDYPKLSIFATAADFVAFMDAEYEKAGEPEKYKEAMRRVRGGGGG